MRLQPVWGAGLYHATFVEERSQGGVWITPHRTACDGQMKSFNKYWVFTMGEMLTEAQGIRNETVLASDSGAVDQGDQQLKRHPKTVSSSPAMSARSLETTGGAPTNSWEASKKGFLSLAFNLDGDQMNKVGMGVGWISRWGSKGEEREGRETVVCLQLFDRSCTKRSCASAGLAFGSGKGQTVLSP